MAFRFFRRHFFRPRQRHLLILAVFSLLALRIFIGQTDHARNSPQASHGLQEFLSHLVGFNDDEELMMAKAYKRRKERIRYVVEKYGEAACGLHLLGVPGIVHKHGCTEAQCSTLTCSNLLFGNGTGPVYDFARKWMALHNFDLVSDKDPWPVEKNCSQEPHLCLACKDFIRSGNYRMYSPTHTEGSTVIAYNLIVHKEIDQLERLLRTIYRPQNVYCVHIDKKAPEGFRNNMAAIIQCFPNMYLVSEPVSVIYGSFSRLQADINCMKDQLRHPIKWDYLINLAGQAFPLKTNEELVQILRVYNGANDIAGIYGINVLRGRFEKRWKFVAKGDISDFQQTGEWKESPPYDLDILKGSVYGVFSRRFVEWVISDVKAQALLRWSEDTYSPDEHYFATLHHTFSNPQLDPPGGYSGNPNTKPWLSAYSSWDFDSEPCRGKYVREVCIFGVGDLPTLVDRMEIFANKLYLDYEPLTYSCLENWIDYKWRCPFRFDKEFYEALPFINRTTRTLG